MQRRRRQLLRIPVQLSSTTDELTIQSSDWMNPPESIRHPPAEQEAGSDVHKQTHRHCGAGSHMFTSIETFTHPQKKKKKKKTPKNG